MHTVRVSQCQASRRLFLSALYRRRLTEDKVGQVVRHGQILSNNLSINTISTLLIQIRFRRYVPH